MSHAVNILALFLQNCLVGCAFYVSRFNIAKSRCGKAMTKYSNCQ